MKPARIIKRKKLQELKNNIKRHLLEYRREHGMETEEQIVQYIAYRNNIYKVLGLKNKWTNGVA